MNSISNTSLLKSSSCKKQSFNKTCILKKPLLHKSHKFVKNFSNIFNDAPKNNNLKFERYQNDSDLKEEKYKKVLLPLISTEHSSIINSTKNTESKESNRSSRKSVKINKLKINKMNKSSQKFSYQNDKNLIRLYNEDFKKKKKLDLYKANNNNLKNFSFRNYNINLLKLSSINLSKNNFKIFKKNMKSIQCALNGIKLKRNNKWMKFLEKIEDIAPESLRKKIISFSRDKIGDLF